MKKAALFLLLFPIFLSCNGQGSKIAEMPYSMKLEFGLKGAVKEVTAYTHYAADGKIPPKNAKSYGETTMTFDNQGNAITKNTLWDIGSVGKSVFSSRFFGKGRAISSKETAHLYDGEFKEDNYTYIWSDNYTYTISSEKETDWLNIITLDPSNYRLLKSVFKNKEGVIESMEEYETTYQDNKILEIKNTITDNIDGKKKVTYRIQVVQEYDKNGNPAVIYGYDNTNKQKIQHVIYKKYTYYK